MPPMPNDAELHSKSARPLDKVFFQFSSNEKFSFEKFRHVRHCTVGTVDTVGSTVRQSRIVAVVGQTDVNSISFLELANDTQN